MFVPNELLWWEKWWYRPTLTRLKPVFNDDTFSLANHFWKNSYLSQIKLQQCLIREWWLITVISNSTELKPYNGSCVYMLALGLMIGLIKIITWISVNRTVNWRSPHSSLVIPIRNSWYHNVRIWGLGRRVSGGQITSLHHPHNKLCSFQFVSQHRNLQFSTYKQYCVAVLLQTKQT